MRVSAVTEDARGSTGVWLAALDGVVRPLTGVPIVKLSRWEVVIDRASEGRADMISGSNISSSGFAFLASAIRPVDGSPETRRVAAGRPAAGSGDNSLRSRANTQACAGAGRRGVVTILSRGGCIGTPGG